MTTGRLVTWGCLILALVLSVQCGQYPIPITATRSAEPPIPAQSTRAGLTVVPTRPLTGTATPTNTTTNAPTPGWLHTDGRWIKDAAGKDVRLRGVNTYVCLQNEQAKFNGIKSLGANTIRLAFWKDAIEGNPDGPCAGTPGLTNLDQAIAYAKNAGLMVILDQHIWTYQVEPAPMAFFTDSVTQGSWLAVWRTVIDRYKNDPTIIGIDLMNEPWSIANRPANAQSLWEGIAKRAVTELKPRNPNFIFFVSGWGPQTQPMWSDIGFLQQPNVAITDHIYGQKTYDWLNTRYAPYINASIPVWLGEIGFTASESSFMVSQLTDYEKLGLHYTLFVYGVNSWHLDYDIVNSAYGLTEVGKLYGTFLTALPR